MLSVSTARSPRVRGQRSTSRTRRSSTKSAALRRRAEELMRREIEFVSNPEFDVMDEEHSEIVDATLHSADNISPSDGDLPMHLNLLSRTEVMSHEQEQAMFREMNQLKFRASALRSNLDPSDIHKKSLDEIDRLLTRALQIRNHIIQANMRLVISIVKKFASPTQSFDDLMGDGTIILMNAVEKFDFSRGFRFSTYAYRSIVRGSYRNVVSAREEKLRFIGEDAEQSFEQANDSSASSLTDQAWSNLRSLTSDFLKELDRRERFVIRSRYALGSHRRVRTFQFLADKLGVSKERARQIERRAVGKLQKMAGEVDLDALLGVSVPR